MQTIRCGWSRRQPSAEVAWMAIRRWGKREEESPREAMARVLAWSSRLTGPLNPPWRTTWNITENESVFALNENDDFVDHTSKDGAAG